MKNIILILTIIVSSNVFSFDYGAYLKKVQKEMEKMGLNVDVYAQNPFQTGTALTNYFLSEKILLLERDAFFQMKANKLKTTENIADFQHRLKLLNAHANNLLIHLMRSVKTLNEEGFLSIEKPKHQQTLDELIEECKKDSSCIANRLQNPETSVESNLIQNFALATQVFDQIPYMHALEVNATYQLIQLVYLEAFHARSTLSRVEFEIFHKKQKKLKKQIEKNRNLTETERKYHSELVENTVNKWKKRILERKVDSKNEFAKKAQEIREQNEKLALEIEELQRATPEIKIEEYKCFSLRHWSDHRRCKKRKIMNEMISDLKSGDNFFIGEKESELPKWFWKKI